MSQSVSEQLTVLVSGIASAVTAVNPGDLEQAAGVLLNSRRAGRTVSVCGNGVSAGLANHAANDLIKAGLRAVSLSANPEVITATGNDDGYENVFSWQLSRLARDGDVLVTISSSGKSPNIAKALG